MGTTLANIKRDEEYDVFIGRPSKWGNPFSHLPSTLAQYKVSCREEAVDKYREWILTQPRLLADLEELRGKRLGCFCAPKLCHGHVLIELLENSEICGIDIKNH
jgi:hypothetical protein